MPCPVGLNDQANGEVDKNQRARERTLAETADSLRVKGFGQSFARQGQYQDGINPLESGRAQFEQFQAETAIPETNAPQLNTASVEGAVRKADPTRATA